MLKMRSFKRAMLECFGVRVITINGEFRVFGIVNNNELHDEVLGSEDVFTDREIEAKLDQWVSRRVDPSVLSTFSQLSELLRGSMWSLSLHNQYYGVLEYNHRDNSVTKSIYGEVKYAVAVTAKGALEFIDFINALPLHETLAGLSELETFTSFVKMK